MLMNKNEIAKELSLSVAMIDKLMKLEPEPMPYIKIGKTVRFDKEDVIEWAKKRRK